MTETLTQKWKSAEQSLNVEQTPQIANTKRFLRQHKLLNPEMVPTVISEVDDGNVFVHHHGNDGLEHCWEIGVDDVIEHTVIVDSRCVAIYSFQLAKDE